MKRLFEKHWYTDMECTSARLLRIGGVPQEEYRCSCSHCEQDRDCCGNWFCWNVKSYLNGFITIGYYSMNI